MSNHLKAFDATIDINSPNRNISPITTRVSEEGELMIGGCNLQSLVEKYGTPLYLLDEDTIRESCRAYKKALEIHYPGPSQPLYASKANSSLALAKIMSQENMGLDVVSEGEMITALRGGLSGSQIFLHGNNKSEQELLIAYQKEVTIVIDNYHDIDQLEKIIPSKSKPLNIMLRFTPGIECHTHEYIRTGHLDSKFGFDPDELENALNRLKEIPWAQLTGIHAHIGSQIFELAPHRDLIGVMADAYQLALKIGHPMKDLNVGGGLGVKYIESDKPPSIDQWIREISLAVKKSFGDRNIQLPRLMCEPGRSLIAIAGVTLYRLGAHKEIPNIRKYISIDGGMSDNPRPITYKSDYSACLVKRPLDLVKEKVTIAGKHCESGDVLLKDFFLPSTNSGDVLAVFATGAYNYSMSSNYNRIPRPATVLLKNGLADLVQRREESEDLLQFDIIPDRFIGNIN